jgi:hypothetical protein
VTLDSPAMPSRVAVQVVIGHLFSRRSAVSSRTRLARFLSATGETSVRRLLATLPADWTAFHAVPIGENNTDIDHILVGPGGIFTIDSRRYSGKHIRVGSRTVTVSGQGRAPLSAATQEAERVTLVLRERMPLVAPVQPVIALVDARQISFRGRPEQVKVLDARGLLCWLEGLQPVLSDDEIAEAVVILDSPVTWPAQRTRSQSERRRVPKRAAAKAPTK